MTTPNPLAKVSPTASTWTDLYTPPVVNGSATPPFLGLGTVTVYICPTQQGTVGLASTSGTGVTPAATDYLLYQEQVRQIGPLLVTNPATLRCFSSVAGTSFIVMGIEE